MVNKHDGGSATSLWVNQIAYGTNNKIYFRQNINSTGWTEWKAVAFEGSINATLTVNGKTYNGSEAVDAGVQTVANGGTGVTTQADINKAFISNLDVGESDVTDGTEFVSSYASDSGFSSTDEGSLHTPYKRQFVKVWNYIKGKISSVLGLTKDNYGGKAASAGNAGTADSLFYMHGNEINFKGGAQAQCWFNYRNADIEGPSPVDTMEYRFCNYSGDTTKSVLMAGSFNGTTAKASNKMVIPIGAPSSLEDGCIWIER